MDKKDIFLSEEDTRKKLSKAVFKTKGFCNNKLALDIARRASSTVEDIIRIATDNELPNRWDKALSGSKRKMRETHRSRIEAGRIIPFTETVTWRYFVKNGLTDIAKAYNFDKLTIRTDDRHTRWASEIAEVMMFAKAGVDVSKISEQVMRAIRDVRTVQEYGFDNEIRQFMQNELKWLVAIPENIQNEMANSGITTMSKAVWDSNGHQQIKANLAENSTYAYHQKWQLKGEVARMKSMAMSEYLNYMGIGVIGLGTVYSGARRRNGIMPLARQVMSANNKFMSMIKKGFDVSLVRDEIVTMLNNHCEAKINGGVKWKFYACTDAPTEYPELVVTKTAKLGKSGSSSPTIVKLEGDDVKVFKTADGREIKFDLTEAV